MEHDFDFWLPHPRGRLDRGPGQAFTLADEDFAYVEAAVKSGSTRSPPALLFFFNVHNNFFEEIAKFRAARRLWARIMKERFGVRDPRSMMVRFHAQTAGMTLTAQQAKTTWCRSRFRRGPPVLGGAAAHQLQGRSAGAAH